MGPRGRSLERGKNSLGIHIDRTSPLISVYSEYCYVFRLASPALQPISIFDGSHARLRLCSRWVDCATGAARRDVTLEAGTRLFFSTRVWPDAAALAARQTKGAALELEMAQAKSDAGSWATPNNRFFYWFVWKIDVDLAWAKLRDPSLWLQRTQAQQRWAQLRRARDDLNAGLPSNAGITSTSLVAGTPSASLICRCRPQK